MPFTYAALLQCIYYVPINMPTREKLYISIHTHYTLETIIMGSTWGPVDPSVSLQVCCSKVK